MKLVNNTIYSLDQSFDELEKEFSFLLSDINVVIDSSSKNNLEFNLDLNTLKINCMNQRDIDYLLHIANAKGLNTSYQINLPERKISDLSFMIDCSRNNVPKLETVYRLIRYLSYMGYDTLKLYLEDTYVIKDEPYFGYLRNGYTPQDLKDIDQYAAIFDMNVIPCIQTLAHLTAVNRWCVYNKLFDYDDILFVDEPEVYILIDKMFKTLSSCFRSNKINIGMDEAYFLGRGKYLDKNGYQPRYEILSKHLDKVLKLCEKYNFEPEMWSDMFFSYSQFAYQDSLETKLPKLNIPANLKLVYWDYELRDDAYIDKILQLHKNMTDNIAYAGGAWKWIGFAPNNTLSIEELRRYFNRCAINNIGEITVTGWGDNGGECSVFSVLPTLNFAGNAKYFGGDVDSAKYFKCLTDISFENFMQIDNVNQVGANWSALNRNYMSSTFLYNDPLLGIYDSTVRIDQSKIYKGVTKSLEASCANEKFGYIFKTLTSLCSLLTNKCDLGLRLRNAYKDKNLVELNKVASELNTIKNKLTKFYEDFSFQWHLESRSNGFDIQDLRIGGLNMRLEHTNKLLNNFLNGQIDQIDELEETIKDFYGKDDDWEKPDDLCESSYRKIASVNINK